MSGQRGDAVKRVRAALEKHGSRITGNGSQFMAQCPAPDHDDHEPSLSVGQGDKGAVLNCQVCGPDATPQIVAALGLTMGDLFDVPREPQARQQPIEYRYTDADGNLLFVKVRRPGKKFTIKRPDGNGGWLWDLPADIPRVMYNLAAVQAAGREGGLVILVEGEKDADRLNSMGYIATCNFDGASKAEQSPKWRPEYGDMLRGAVVVVIADRDEAGIAHARAAIADLAGKAKQVRGMLPATTGTGDDVSDHLNAGHDLRDLVPLAEPAADAAPAHPSAQVAGTQQNGTAADAAHGRRLVLTPASAIEPEPVVWAWEDNGHGRVPSGSMGLYAGREGTGKSSFLIWQAAQITTGKLHGAWHGSPRAVIYVAVEDSWKYTIVPRLMAAGANLDLVYRAEVHVIQVEEETVSLSLPADFRLLEEAITSHNVAMVALDPLISAISDQLDTHVNRDVRRALDPMARMADRTGAVIAGIAHFNKSAGPDASSLVTGSGAFKDVARFIFAFATDPEDGAQVITQTKNSLGMSNLPSLDYRIIEAIVPTAKGDARVGRFVPGGISERSVHDILAAQGHGSDRDEKTRAEDYLKKALAGGPRLSKTVEEEAREGERISKRTLDRARGDLRVVAAKRGDGWWISLPEHEGDLRSPAETSKDAKGATVGKDGKDDKGAKSSSPGEVGTVGILPAAATGSADGNRDLGYLAGTGPQTPRQPPCDSADPKHAACWELSDGWFVHDGQCLNLDGAA